MKEINPFDFVDDFKKNIKNQQQVTRKPEYSQKELYTDNHGLGDTYIEVNLTEQHLYYYKKGKWFWTPVCVRKNDKRPVYSTGSLFPDI